MKKIISIIIIGIFIISGLEAIATPFEQNQKTIKEIIKISKPIINDKQDYIELNLKESNLNLIESGKPLLPKLTKVYSFPFETKITDITITFSEEIQYRIPKLIEPSPETLIISSKVLNKWNIF